MSTNYPPGFIKNLMKWHNAKLRPEEKTYHVTRLPMYLALKDALAKKAKPHHKTLAISNSAPLAETLGLHETKIKVTYYPKVSMLTLPFEDNSFNFCVSDQVLEHVDGNPFKAVAESYRVVKPGGWVCHTTCFINPIHGSPDDYWRFTPNGLKLIAEECGFERINSAGAGNRFAWALVDEGLRRLPLPADPKHPAYKAAIEPDDLWPITVWFVAQKPKSTDS